MKTATGVRDAAVLMEPRKKESKVQKGWRLRSSVVDFIECLAKGGDRGAEAQLVEKAVELLREVRIVLAEEPKELQRFLKEEGLEGLDLEQDSARVIGRILRRGLRADAKKEP